MGKGILPHVRVSKQGVLHTSFKSGENGLNSIKSENKKNSFQPSITSIILPISNIKLLVLKFVIILMNL